MNTHTHTHTHTHHDHHYRCRHVSDSFLLAFRLRKTSVWIGLSRNSRNESLRWSSVLQSPYNQSGDRVSSHYKHRTSLSTITVLWLLCHLTSTTLWIFIFLYIHICFLVTICLTLNSRYINFFGIWGVVKHGHLEWTFGV